MTAVEEFTEVFGAEHRQVRDLLLKLRQILRSRGAGHVAVLGLGGEYLRLRARLGGLGLARRKARRPPANVSAGQGFMFISGDPYAEDPWCSCQPGTFPYPDDLAAMGLRPAA